MRSLISITACVFLIACGSSSGTTIAYWQFDEGSGQKVANEISSTAELQLGNSGGEDIYEPTWATGLRGNALKYDLYSENGNITNFTKNSSSWVASDATSLAPTGSYSVEMLINADSFPAWGAGGPMGLIVFKDIANGKIQYLMRTYISATGTKLLGFYSQHSDGTATNLYMDVDAAGLVMSTHKWYYAAAIFDSATNNLELIIRDMDSGDMASQSFASKPVFGTAATPNPLFGVGYEGGTGRCFDGLIDEIRISDTALADEARLYKVPEPATLALLISGAIFYSRRKSL